MGLALAQLKEFPKAPRGTPDQLPLKTQGRWIMSRDNKRVKWACVNWAGAHQTFMVPGGLDRQHRDNIAKLIVDMGFNCVRLNWSTQMVMQNPLVSEIDDIAGKGK